MFRRPGEDYTAHGAHYTATSSSHSAHRHRSYAVSGTFCRSSCVKLIPLFFRSSRSDIRVWTSTRLTRSTVYFKRTNTLTYDSFTNAVRLSTGPQPLPKPVLHRVRCSISTFNLQYPLFCLRSFSSCLSLLSRLPVNSILPSIFPSTTCLRRQFLRNM